MLTRSSGWWKGVDARRRLAWLVSVLAVAVAAALSGPFALRIYYLEIGGRALDEARAFAAAHPGAVNPALDRAIRYLQRAVAISPSDGYAYRRLGQAWLLLGNNDSAAESLRRAVELRPNHPLTHIELGYAYDGLGQVDQALAEYEQGGYGPAVEAAIVNYLKVADWHAAAGGGNEALHILNDRVLRLDPTNLPALYRAVKIYQGMSEQAAKEFAGPMRERLQHFQAASVIVPSEPRLAEYLAQTMASLVDEGIWQRDTLLNVVSYQVWQSARGPSARATERLLQALLQRWPEDPDLLFYLAELYHRQGELERAEAAYRQVLSVAPQLAQVYLRLGMISEARTGAAASDQWLEEAAKWYAQYQELARDDLMVLNRLVKVCTALGETGRESEGCRMAALRVPVLATGAQANSGTSKLEIAPADALRKALEARTDDRRIVAEMLGVSLTDVELGLNLVQNGGFEEWEEGRPNWWVWTITFGQGPWNDAVFAGGAEGDFSFEGRESARVDGLRVQREPEKEPARLGFWQYDERQRQVQPVELVPATAYVLSFYYRTQRVPDGQAAIYLKNDHPDTFWINDRELPATGGAWYHFVAISWNQSAGKVFLYPLPRSYSTGSAEFDEVSIRPIRLSETARIKSKDTQIQVIGEPLG